MSPIHKMHFGQALHLHLDAHKPRNLDYARQIIDEYKIPEAEVVHNRVAKDVITLLAPTTPSNQDKLEKIARDAELLEVCKDAILDPNLGPDDAKSGKLTETQKYLYRKWNLGPETQPKRLH
jgi:hypothetical protein